MGPMTTQRTRLLSKEEIADSTMTFHFEKPAGMSFTAGQYLHWTLVDPPETDDDGVMRAFTLASAPYENTIMATTRIRDSAYKRGLTVMEVGDEMELDEPQGKLVLHDDADRPAVFVTGGIGITPVRSMVLQSTHENSGHPLFVFYSNKRPEDAAFMDDFRSAAAENERVTFIPTMTEVDASDEEWEGERGHIDAAMLSRHLPDLGVATYYLSGPAGMIEGMETMLREAGVQDADIRSEEFPGY